MQKNIGIPSLLKNEKAFRTGMCQCWRKMPVLTTAVTSCRIKLIAAKESVGDRDIPNREKESDDSELHRRQRSESRNGQSSPKAFEADC